MTQLVVISDTHVNPWTAFAHGTGLNNDRMQQTLAVMRASLQRARNDKAIWVHAADIIHTTGYAKHEVAAAVIDLLVEYRDVPMVMVWGNHDSRGRGSRVEERESFQYVLKAAIPELHLLDGDVVEVQGITFTGLGAQPRVTMLDIPALPDADVAILHAQVSGASFPSGTLAHGLDPEQLLRFPLTIVGDIHHPHIHEENGSVILIPGSPEHHNFGDKGPRGWWVVDIERPMHKGNIEFVGSGSPEFRTVQTPAEVVAGDGNFYRVMGEVNEPLPANANAVAAGPSTVEARDLLAGAHETRDILARWVALNNPPVAEKRMVSYGMALLGDVEQTTPQPVMLRKVEMKNFFSYADSEWVIEPGVHSISGQSADFNSNGAGKSTLAEAVYWAITNKNTKKTDAADVVRWGAAEGCTVTLTMDLRGSELVVQRTRTKTGGDLVVTLDGVPLEAKTTTDLGNVLLATIGLTPELYRSLGYFSQEDVILLSRSTDAEVKNRLADLRGTAMYERGAEAARAAQKAAEREAEGLVGRTDVLTSQMAVDGTSVAEAAARVQEWDAQRETIIRTAEESVRCAKADAERAEAAKSTRTDRAQRAANACTANERARLNASVDAAAEVLAQQMTAAYEAERSRISSDLVNAKASIPTGFDVFNAHEQVQDAKEALTKEQEMERALQATLGECRRIDETNRNEYQRLTVELENATAGQCPTCGQSYPGAVDAVQRVQTAMEDLRTRQEANVQRQQDAKAQLAELKVAERIAYVADMERIAGVCERIRTMQTTLTGLAEKISVVEDAARTKAQSEADTRHADFVASVNARIARIGAKLDARVTAATSATATAERELARIAAESNPHRAALTSAETRLAQTKRNRWLAHLAARRASRQVAMAKYWDNGFGKAGIQSLLIDELAAAFNELRSTVFPTLTRGVYDVQFSTTSRTRGGELRERIEFQVYRRGVRIPYANLSGGQRRRVDLGVLLTMTAAASRMYGIHGTLGIMVLDEVTSFLDDDGAQALAEVLAEYVDVVPSVYVVSQEESLQALFPSTITVMQDENGVSTLGYA